MPVVFRYKSFRFFFYSNEGNSREDMHIHVRCGFGEAKFWLTPRVNLADGRVIGAPLTWFPRWLHASTEQRSQVELSAAGLHWDALDEDISVQGLLQGHGDLTRSRLVSAV